MKGKRTDMSKTRCAIARSLQIIGDWWSLLIVRDAFQGRERFNEFQRSLGLAKNILSTRLKKLVEADVFAIVPDPDSSLSHRYVLTPKGEQLYVVLAALWQWGEENCFARGERELAMVDVLERKPLARLQLVAQDGRAVGPRDFRIVSLKGPVASPVARTARKKRPARSRA